MPCISGEYLPRDTGQYGLAPLVDPHTKTPVKTAASVVRSKRVADGRDDAYLVLDTKWYNVHFDSSEDQVVAQLVNSDVHSGRKRLLKLVYPEVAHADVLDFAVLLEPHQRLEGLLCWRGLWSGIVVYRGVVPAAVRCFGVASEMCH